MSADHVLNPRQTLEYHQRYNYFQTSMFEPAGRLANDFKSQDLVAAGDDQDALRRIKLDEAHKGSQHSAWGSRLPTEESFYDNVKREGVREPVTVEPPTHEGGDPKLWNGNHRVQVSHDIDPSREIPVRWTGRAHLHSDWGVHTPTLAERMRAGLRVGGLHGEF